MKDLMIMAAVVTAIALLIPLLLAGLHKCRVNGLIHAANTTDAATEVHATSIRATAESALAARHLLVTQGTAAGEVDTNGAATVPLGTVDNIVAIDEAVTVLLLGKGTTKKMVASEAISKGARVYAAASGKVAASGTVMVGTALSATTTDNDIVEVLDCEPIRVAGETTGDADVAADVLAIPVTARVVNKTTGADAEALTLADGVPGQRLSINLAVDGGGTGTLTPTTATGFVSIAFADAGDTVDLEYVDDTVGWIVVGSAGVAAPPAIALT